MKLFKEIIKSPKLDYPYEIKLKDNSSYEFNTKENKNKFINFIIDYNINSTSNITTGKKEYKYFYPTKHEEYSNFFDHMNIFNGKTKNNELIRFITIQPYTYENDERLLDYIYGNKLLNLICAYYGHTIHIFRDNKYNWHHEYTTFILFALDHNLKKCEYTEINIHYKDKIKVYKIKADYSLTKNYKYYDYFDTKIIDVLDI